MARKIVLAALIISAVPCSSAQPADQPPPVPVTSGKSESNSGHTEFIVIDASGSMKGLEAEVLRKLDAKLTLLDGNWRRSITFFGAASADPKQAVTCESDIKIEPLSALTDALPKFPPLGGPSDKTAISNALEAALRAGGSQASVVLITDGAEECEPRFTELRSEYPSAKIRVLQVGSKPNPDLQAIEDQPSTKPAPEPVTPSRSAPFLQLAIEIGSDDPPSTSMIGINGITLFIEKWLWLLGMVMLGGAAVKWGFERQSLALERETAAGQLQQLRLAALVDDNEEAKNKLRAAIDAANSERTNLKEAGTSSTQQSLVARVSSAATSAAQFSVQHKFGVTGLLILVLLPLLPEYAASDLFSVGRAQQAAWTALNSSFAEAFSLIAIAIVFFAASQQRRLNEAVEKFGLATDQAEWTEAQLKAEHEKFARVEYAAAERDLRALSFSLPPQTGRATPAKLEADKHAFRVVSEAAISLAAGATLGKSAQVTHVEQETSRLLHILSAARPSIWAPLQKPPFARFLTATLDERPELSGQSEYATWKSLADRFHTREAWPLIHKLAQLLTRPQTDKKD